MSRQRHDPITKAIKHGDYHPTSKRLTKEECNRRVSALIGKQFTMKDVDRILLERRC